MRNLNEVMKEILMKKDKKTLAWEMATTAWLNAKADEVEIDFEAVMAEIMEDLEFEEYMFEQFVNELLSGELEEISEEELDAMEEVEYEELPLEELIKIENKINDLSKIYGQKAFKQTEKNGYKIVDREAHGIWERLEELLEVVWDARKEAERHPALKKLRSLNRESVTILEIINDDYELHAKKKISKNELSRAVAALIEKLNSYNGIENWLMKDALKDIVSMELSELDETEDKAGVALIKTQDLQGLLKDICLSYGAEIEDVLEAQELRLIKILEEIEALRDFL